jgi:hypothetical protein
VTYVLQLEPIDGTSRFRQRDPSRAVTEGASPNLALGGLLSGQRVTSAFQMRACW